MSILAGKAKLPLLTAAPVSVASMTAVGVLQDCRGPLPELLPLFDPPIEGFLAIGCVEVVLA